MSKRPPPPAAKPPRKRKAAANKGPASAEPRRTPAPARLPPRLDVLVLGAHPAAHLAAAVLATDQPELAVAHVVPPGETLPDRLLTLNPRLADLHPSLRAGAALGDLTAVAGLQFLSDQPGVRGEHVVAKPPAMLVGATSGLTRALAAAADGAGVNRHAAHDLRLVRVVDDGVAVAVDGQDLVARTVILASPSLPADQQRLLGISLTWEPGVLHRYTFQRFKPPAGAIDPAASAAGGVVPMSLDLAGTGAWAWLLRHADGTAQVSVQQPLRTTRSHPPRHLLVHWCGQLARHGIFRSAEAMPDVASAVELDLPVAGALSAETVANRTLLIGPAGGFYSTCGEDVYPACWSAVAAAAVVGRALRANHVQDALQAYRAEWGSTLGDYLRGPQQNLTLLLPLIYKNAVMAARVAEAILFGESVVR